MKKILPFAFLGLSLILAGCAQQSAQPINQGQPVTTGNNIVIQNFSFNPAVLSIAKGTTVIWTNEDSVVHKIKSDTFNSNNLNRGDSFEFKFDNVGTYDYVCAIHSNMKGKIIVN
ncbi:MAG: cupredoxin domain-containing protein [Patescibacteria group bacterium]|jgi:plastocyanin